MFIDPHYTVSGKETGSLNKFQINTKADDLPQMFSAQAAAS